MENNAELSKLYVRKVTQDVILFVWFKQEVIPDKPKPELRFIPEISSEFLNNLCNSVWIESYRNEFQWEEFLKNHFERMSATPYLFTNYIIYACYLLGENAANAYEIYFLTLSLLTHFVLHFWQRERKEFINMCVDLFCVFFEKEIRMEFEIQGGWENFNGYLESLDILKRYKELVSNKQTVYELFKEFQNKHLESDEEYSVNDVVLKDITANQVETDLEAITFTESVADQMKSLCNNSFEEVFSTFAKTDKQIEEIYRQKTGVASGGTLNKDKDLPEEIKKETENTSSKTKSKKKSRKKEVKAVDNCDPFKNFEDLGPAPQESDLFPEAAKEERIKKLLSVMVEDISKISELIRFLCEEKETEVPGS